MALTFSIISVRAPPPTAPSTSCHLSSNLSSVSITPPTPPIPPPLISSMALIGQTLSRFLCCLMMEASPTFSWIHLFDSLEA